MNGFITVDTALVGVMIAGRLYSVFCAYLL
jgi:hypothetical protein